MSVSETPNSGQQSPAVAAGKPMILLAIDDCDSDIQLLSLALLHNAIPHELHSASDGDKGLDFLFRRGKHADAPRPDLILLDINMPRMNGHEVLAVLKADDDLKHIPVVMFTTSTAPHDIRQSYEQYANTYVTKPLMFSDMLEKVRVVIRDYWLGTATLPQD